MALELVMPRLSDSMEEGTIVSWLVSDGAPVVPGQEIAEIETDKATVPYEAPEAGVLRILVPQGTTLRLGEPIALIDDLAPLDAGHSVAPPGAHAPAAGLVPPPRAAGTEPATSSFDFDPAHHEPYAQQLSVPPPGPGVPPRPAADPDEGETTEFTAVPEAHVPLAPPRAAEPYGTVERQQPLPWVDPALAPAEHDDEEFELVDDLFYEDEPGHGAGDEELSTEEHQLVREVELPPVGAEPAPPVEPLLEVQATAAEGAPPVEPEAPVRLPASELMGPRPPRPLPPQPQVQRAAPAPASRVIASPVARRLATELGIDLASLQGTGPDGRIIRADVEAAVAAGASRPPVAAASAVPSERAPQPPVAEVPQQPHAPEIPSEPTPAPEIPSEPAPAPEIPSEPTPGPGIPTDPVPAREVPAEPTPGPEVPSEPDAPQPAQPEVPQPQQPDVPNEPAEPREPQEPATPAAPEEPAEPSAPEPETPLPPADAAATTAQPAAPPQVQLAHDGADVPQVSLAAPGAEAAQAADAEKRTLAAAQAGGGKGEPERIELTRQQATLARRMAESKATIPDYHLTVTVDVGPLTLLREELRATRPELRVPTVNDLVVKATAVALRAFPRLNGAYRDGGIEQYPRVNVGIAVDAGSQLLVPVVHDADRLAVGQIAERTADIAARARAGGLRPPDVASATFTVTNLGGLGIERFTAVINPGQAGMLSVGAVQERAVVRDGALAAARVMELTLICDHRAVYGAEAARFLGRIRGLLQRPAGLLA